jgi:electron transfer flavoprotein beta subunit
MPVVTVARSLEAIGDAALRVVRVTPDGDETVEVSCPAIVTISNELGQPRYPTMAGRMAARKKRATVVPAETLGVPDLRPQVVLARQFVPAVKGACEIIAGGTAAEAAERLVARLRADGVLRA